ncbi:OsmC family protein [Psychroflexus sp. CAK8W]|uniref:OsmC family protein n=1 Tax=Psychroflexus longus TaxID=2873596 RepID=A0ABS7XJU6_9FLAO|nr:OsmC family protein [Psychroflexus longus]MBZ9779258.1 OsmC family protein [Psychroflexus longus]
MKISLHKKHNSDVHFEAENALGHKIELYNSTAPDPKAPSPMELILMGTAGCSSIDIVHILKKQNLEIKNLDVEVEGLRQDTDPKVFHTIKLLVKLEGDIPANKAKRAAQLSFEKYCSVSKMLDATVDIQYQVQLNGELLE